MQEREKPDSPDRLRRFLAHADYRAALPYVAAVGVLVLAIAAAGREIDHHIASIESWIDALGAWGLLAFMGLFVAATSFLLPDTVLCFIAGVLFGFWRGIGVVLAGSLLAAALQFALSRRILRAPVGCIIGARPSLAAIQQAVRRDEFRLQVLLRLTPLNPATINYLLGAAGVRFWGFLTACLALTFTLAIEVYFGYTTKHVARMAGGVRSALLHDLAIIGGLAVCVVVMVIVSRMARKAVIEAAAISPPAAGQA
jgi:uncharacterized membrane protein YdjX (TVP38/TMEM64 family)